MTNTKITKMLGSAGEICGKLKPVAPRICIERRACDPPFVWQTGTTKKRSQPADQRTVFYVPACHLTRTPGNDRLCQKTTTTFASDDRYCRDLSTSLILLFIVVTAARLLGRIGRSAIRTFETSTDVRYTAAFGGNADIEPTSPNDRI
jgi:hypothetical protein